MEQWCCVLVLAAVAVLLGSQAAVLKEAEEEDPGDDDFPLIPPIAEDWQAGKSLQQAMEYLFVHKVGADVTFTVRHASGPSRGVPIVFQAHRTVLSARSSVMNALLVLSVQEEAEEEEEDDLEAQDTAEEDLEDPLEEERGMVMVTDVDPEAFRQMLRYMYTDTALITQDNVMYVAAAAKLYKLPGLQSLVGAFLKQSLNQDTVFGLLRQGVYFEDHDLIAECLEVLSEAGAPLLQAPGFTEMSLEDLQYVADIPRINCYEVELFRACLRWAEARGWNNTHDGNGSGNGSEHVRQLLDPVIAKIRFPAMSLGEFTEDVVQSGVLSAEEVSLVYQQIITSSSSSISSSSSSSSPPPQHSPFNAANRGKPVQYPADILLQGTISTTRNHNSRRNDVSTITCFVNTNVTLLKVFALGTAANRQSSYSEFKIEQNDRSYSYRFNELEVFENENKMKFTLGQSIAIEQGYFVMEFVNWKYGHYSVASYNLDYSPKWQRQTAGSTDWHFHSSGTPFYGLQYQTPNQE